MIWVHQVKTFGLGNFINLTPTIRHLSVNILNEKVKVYFDLEFVKQCFLDCPFIEILEEKPKCQPILSSSLTNKSVNLKPDYQYIYEYFTNKEWIGQQCYVDKPDLTIGKGFFVMVNGSGNESKRYVDSKSANKEIYLDAIRATNLSPVFVGSEEDLKRNPWAERYAWNIGNIRNSLALINAAEFVVGNDTGLIHAAGAMNKKTFVFWKDTQLPRCMNSGDDCTYLMRGQWSKIRELIEGLR